VDSCDETAGTAADFELSEATATDEIAPFVLLGRLVAVQPVAVGGALQFVPAFVLDGQCGIENHGDSWDVTARGGVLVR